MGQLVYAMFIANDRASLRLWWGGDFLGGISGYCVHDCGFRFGWYTTRGGVSVFYGFFASIGGIFLLAGGLGAEFPKILSLTSFGNSYIPCL